MSWPIVGDLDGVEVVTIPRAVYDGLLLLQTRLKGQRPKARLDRDKEVGQFVDCCLEEQMIYADIRAACIERFGAARAPSPQALSRWFRRRR